MTEIIATALEPYRGAARRDVVAAAPSMALDPQERHVRSSENIDKAGREFAQLFFRQFVDEVIPKGKSSLFGGSEVWRSIFVDSIAEALSKNSAFGIQDHFRAVSRPAEESES